MERKTILIVEDEGVLREALEEIFRRDYDLRSASRCSEARRHMTAAVDLALFDYHLPDGNGINLLKEFRVIWPSKPAIVMTGYSTETLAIRALRADATDYIKKPIDPYLIKRKVAVILRGGESGEQAEASNDRCATILEGIAAYIETNYEADITLDRLAEKAGLDRFRFCRAFKARFGRGLATYLNDVRMKNAVDLLVNPNLSIIEIAYSCGYKSIEHFNRTFKTFYGVSPGEHRRLSRTNQVGDPDLPGQYQDPSTDRSAAH